MKIIHKKFKGIDDYPVVLGHEGVGEVVEVGSLVKDFKPDAVVALGGGSAMDCAKAMVYFSGLQVRFVAIATTSGSGSEVTDFSILTHDGVKHPLVDASLCPDVAILDESFLQKLPPALIADTGFDLLSHALEAYAAKDAGAITDALAKDAFCTGLSCLESSCRGDLSVRLDLHQASCMAGMAFSQAGLGLCHAIAHSLGGMFHVPHGRLNAILLPLVLEFNTSAASGSYAEDMAKNFGVVGVDEARGLVCGEVRGGLSDEHIASLTELARWLSE